MTAAEYMNAAAHHQRLAEEELKRKSVAGPPLMLAAARATAHASLATSYLLNAQIELQLRPSDRQAP